MATLPKIVYNFNENSTTTIRDYSENGNDGTGTGLSTANSTRVGKDMVFTDSTNQIDLGNITYLNGATNLCVHLGIDFGTNGNTRKILTKSGQIEISVLSGTSTIRFSLTDSTATTVNLDATYSGSFEDYDLVVVSNAVTLYQDGVSVDTDTITGGMATNSNNMYIGYDGSTNSAVFNLNEFKLYNSAITTDNIDAWIAEPNGIYSDSGISASFAVGDVIGNLLLEDPAENKFGIVTWVDNYSAFRFIPLTDNISGGAFYRRAAHLWDTDRQWGLIITATPEICFYDGMSKSSEVFASNKKVYCLTKNGIITTSSSISSDYTMLNSDNRIEVDCSGGDITITMPSTPIENKEWSIVDIGGANPNKITVNGNGKDISGDSSGSLITEPYEVRRLYYNGTEFILI